MGRWIIAALAFVAILGLTACAGAPQVPPEVAFTPYVQDGTYKIAVSDKIKVSVWNNPDLSEEVPVRPDGNISVPLVGDVRAAGREPQELARDIESRLSAFVRSPQVTVVLTSIESGEFLSHIRVTGAVQKNLSVPYRRGITVVDAIIDAGGVTEFAAANRAKLYRKVDGVVKTYNLRIRDIMEKADMTTNVPLAPGDVISVPEGLF